MKRPIRETLSPLNLKRRGVPSKFLETTIDDFEDYGNSGLETVKEFVRDYIDNLDENFRKNAGVCFYGSNGVGKTMLASIIVKFAYKHRYTSKRCTFNELINAYTKVWNARNLEERENLESEYYNEFKAVEFLVIEELGKELDSKLAIVVLEDVLRYREDKGLVTIFCFNLDPSVLSERYGSSIADLITGNTTPIKIVSKSKRNEAFKEKLEDDD